MHRFTYKFQSHANVSWLIVAICGMSAIGWITQYTSPDQPMNILLFFILISLTTFGAIYYVINNVRRSIFTCVFVSVYLLLRLLGLRDMYYLALLIGCIISLELYLQKR